jgi:hypothetical protein
MSIVALTSMFHQRGGYVGWNRSIGGSCRGSPRKPVSVSADKSIHIKSLGSAYTRIFEVELKLLDELSSPLFELVVERTIEVFRVLVVTPRISGLYQQRLCRAFLQRRCIPDLEQSHFLMFNSLQYCICVLPKATSLLVMESTTSEKVCVVDLHQLLPQ